MILVLLLLSAPSVSKTHEEIEHWTNFVRIGGYGLEDDNADAIVREAQLSHVYGMEADVFVVGRYPNFLNPAASLRSIHAFAEAAHKVGNRAFIYMAGTECITPNADKAAHTVMKDHPEWVQRKVTGEPAVFHSGAAFWIEPGDEDVWISPYAPDWRKTYMERVRQVAATGIDGLYVDVPYWMTHFDGWENSWASFDDFTVAAFRAKSSLDARKDVKLGNFEDAGFRAWIDFRIETIREFLGDISQNARAVNPQIKTIAEIYPGIEDPAVRLGADVYSLYPAVDAIAHEYDFEDGESLASARTQLDWFLYQVGMITFRAFAQEKATWILNYSWDGDKGVNPPDAMKNLAMSVIMTGANFWDAPGHEMAGSNDMATRKQIFEWIGRKQKIFFSPRSPLHPVGVYFSPKSRDYHGKDFLSSYRGTVLALLHAHRDFQVVTPRTLPDFHGESLVLPSVSVLSESEKQSLQALQANGTRLIFTEINASGVPGSTNTLLLDPDPGKAYFAALKKDFSTSSRRPPAELLDVLRGKTEIELYAPPTVAAHFGIVQGNPHIFLANFGGLVPHRVAVPTPASEIRVRIRADLGNNLVYLPFLGEERVLHGTKHGDRLEFTLPAVERGAAVWVQRQR